MHMKTNVQWTRAEVDIVKAVGFNFSENVKTSTYIRWLKTSFCSSKFPS